MSTEADEPYAGMLEQLRSEISVKLPTVDEAPRKSFVEATRLPAPSRTGE